ncbi:MAG: D-alanine--D-alanine ligase family protein [Candidatus Competibacterales bacterium]
MPPPKLTVGVLFGGRSCEHEVSLRSARSVLAAMDPQRFTAVPIAITKAGQWRVLDQVALAGDKLPALASEGRPLALTPEPAAGKADLPPLDVIFPVLHGPLGEDGTVQGLLELAGIPYVGSGVAASAVGMDKAMMKALLAHAGLPVTPHRTVFRRRWRAEAPQVMAECEEAFPYPWFVKPANMGSSIGVTKVHHRGEFAAAMDTAAQYDRKLLVEAGVEDARELEVSVLGNETPRASLPGEIRPKGAFYDYRAKYLADDAELLVPAPVEETLQTDLQTLAIKAFQALDCAGLARVDFLMSRGSSEIFILEINTLPGFTSISMYPKLWEVSGVPYPELIERLILLALERHGETQANQTNFLAAADAPQAP